MHRLHSHLTWSSCNKCHRSWSGLLHADWNAWSDPLFCYIPIHKGCMPNPESTSDNVMIIAEKQLDQVVNLFHFQCWNISVCIISVDWNLRHSRRVNQTLLPNILLHLVHLGVIHLLSWLLSVFLSVKASLHWRQNLRRSNLLWQFPFTSDLKLFEQI